MITSVYGGEVLFRIYENTTWVVFSNDDGTFVGAQIDDDDPEWDPKGSDLQVRDPHPAYDARNAAVLVRPLLTETSIDVYSYGLEHGDVLDVLDEAGYAGDFNLTLDGEYFTEASDPFDTTVYIPAELNNLVIFGWYNYCDDSFAPVSWDAWEEICRYENRLIVVADAGDRWIPAVGTAANGLNSPAAIVAYCEHIHADADGNLYADVGSGWSDDILFELSFRTPEPDDERWVVFRQDKRIGYGIRDREGRITRGYHFDHDSIEYALEALGPIILDAARAARRRKPALWVRSHETDLVETVALIRAAGLPDEFVRYTIDGRRFRPIGQRPERGIVPERLGPYLVHSWRSGEETEEIYRWHDTWILRTVPYRWDEYRVFVAETPEDGLRMAAQWCTHIHVDEAGRVSIDPEAAPE